MNHDVQLYKDSLNEAYHIFKVPSMDTFHIRLEHVKLINFEIHVLKLARLAGIRLAGRHIIGFPPAGVYFSPLTTTSRYLTLENVASFYFHTNPIHQRHYGHFHSRTGFHNFF